jgi:hypothetical protein
MDGSEPGEIVAAAVLSGAPVDLQARQVRYVWLVSVADDHNVLTHGPEYFGQRKQLHSQEPGMDIIGKWIGTYCRKAIVGKTR